jgi:hypothetical protein
MTKAKALILSAATVLAMLWAMACSGLSGQSPVGNNDGGPCPDFSGEYIIGVQTSLYCWPVGDGLIVVTQSGEEVTIEIVLPECVSATMTGTIDCEGNFSVSGPLFDDTLSMEGNLASMNGTISWSSYCTSTWDATSYGYGCTYGGPDSVTGSSWGKKKS